MILYPCTNQKELEIITHKTVKKLYKLFEKEANLHLSFVPDILFFFLNAASIMINLFSYVKKREIATLAFDLGSNSQRFQQEIIFRKYLQAF